MHPRVTMAILYSINDKYNDNEAKYDEFRKAMMKALYAFDIEMKKAISTTTTTSLPMTKTQVTPTKTKSTTNSSIQNLKDGQDDDDLHNDDDDTQDAGQQQKIGKEQQDTKKKDG